MRGFFSAAVVAFDDFQRHRKGQKEADDLIRRLLGTIGTLISQLKNALRLGLLESDSVSVEALVRHTPGGHELWQPWTRGHYVADNKYPRGEPNLIDLLRTEAQLVRLGPRTPSTLVNIGEATSSRKSHPLWECVRNFWILLRELHGFEKSFRLAEMIAVTGCNPPPALNVPDEASIHQTQTRRAVLGPLEAVRTADPTLRWRFW
jgi:hypothetical protein